jgi:hypothetical protein
MTNKKVSKSTITSLAQSSHIVKVAPRYTTYTIAFKKHALASFAKGIPPPTIFKEAGIDISFRPPRYAKGIIRNWLRIIQKKGEKGLDTPLKKGRPRTKGVSEKDRITFLETQVAYLKAENSFLAQLRAQRAESNSRRNKNMRSSSR